MKHISVIICLCSLFFWFCKNDSGNKTKGDSTKITTEPKKGEYYDAGLSVKNALVVADTVEYDVLVKNVDKADEYTEECLKRLNRKVLIDAVFSAVYSGKAIAHAYVSNASYTIDDVKAIEKDCPRDRIGKIHFIEQWFFDEKNFKMGKKVVGVMLAYESLNSEGQVKNYKAGIKVFFNN
jgi:hypothetical protein